MCQNFPLQFSKNNLWVIKGSAPMDNLAGPQTNIPVGNTDQIEATGNTTGTSSCQGLKIKDILEKVDLFNFTRLTEEKHEHSKETEAFLEEADSKVRNYKCFTPALTLKYGTLRNHD